MNFTESLENNVAALKKALDSDDVKYKEIKIGEKQGCIIFVADLTDKSAVGELIIRPAANFSGVPDETTLSETFLSPETENETAVEKTAEKIVGGSSALLCDGVKTAFLFGLIYSVSLTPCVGAFLGSALMLASTQGSAAKGAALLVIYSLGLGLRILRGDRREQLRAQVPQLRQPLRYPGTPGGIAVSESLRIHGGRSRLSEIMELAKACGRGAAGIPGGLPRRDGKRRAVCRGCGV